VFTQITVDKGRNILGCAAVCHDLWSCMRLRTFRRDKSSPSSVHSTHFHCRRNLKYQKINWYQNEKVQMGTNLLIYLGADRYHSVQKLCVFLYTAQERKEPHTPNKHDSNFDIRVREDRVKVFQNKKTIKMFLSRRHVVTTIWRNLHNEGLSNMYYSRNTSRTSK
jgi:hypothetical protein